MELAANAVPHKLQIDVHLVLIGLLPDGLPDAGEAANANASISINISITAKGLRACMYTLTMRQGRRFQALHAGIATPRP